MMLPGYDLWLSGYHRGITTAYCPHVSCPNAEGIEVNTETEYGSTWWTPEECPICHADLQEDPPEEEDEDGDPDE